MRHELSASHPQHVVIVGGGFSGTLTAVHLLREAAPEQVRITLIEQHPRVARGLAYRIWDDSMLLNVPAGNTLQLLSGAILVAANVRGGEKSIVGDGSRTLLAGS